MNIFKLLLLLMGIGVLLYTILAVVNEGPNLFATTLPAMADFGWQGQFHLDFATYLILSGIWVAWRHRFSATGIMLGVLAANLGIIFLSVYLLITINRTDGNMSEVLLGEQART
jgi:hypothetical protein